MKFPQYFAVAALLQLIIVGNAVACSCDQEPMRNSKVASSRADFVFLGKVHSTDTETRRFYGKEGGYSISVEVNDKGDSKIVKNEKLPESWKERKEVFERATFRIDKVYKGPTQSSVSVLHRDGTKSGINVCGYVFRKGHQYLVYASKADDENGSYFITNGCAGTKPLADAEIDINQLEPSGVE